MGLRVGQVPSRQIIFIEIFGLHGERGMSCIAVQEKGDSDNFTFHFRFLKREPRQKIWLYICSMIIWIWRARVYL